MCLAIPGKLVSVEQEVDPMLRGGKVDFAGVMKQVSLALTPEASAGDYVVVHAGFALSVMDEVEAQRIFDDFKLMDELADLEEPDR